MIYGVDIGVRGFHVIGLPSKAKEPQIAVTHTQDKGRSRWTELRDISLRIREFIMPGDTVFIEEPPLAGNRNLRTFAMLNQCAGAILSATAAQGYFVPVDSWKKGTVGKGGVGKPIVAEWLGVHHPELSKLCVGDQNFVDAACIALHGQGLLHAVGGGNIVSSWDMDLSL